MIKTESYESEPRYLPIIFLNSSKLRTPSPSVSYLEKASSTFFLPSPSPAAPSALASLKMKWCSPRYSLLNWQMTSKLLRFLVRQELADIQPKSPLDDRITQISLLPCALSKLVHGASSRCGMVNLEIAIHILSWRYLWIKRCVDSRARRRRGETRAAAQQKSARFHAPFYQ